MFPGEIMSRFIRLSKTQVEQLFRCAQDMSEDIADGLVCPRCGSSFPKDEIENKDVHYGRYMYTCPVCHQASPSTAFGETPNQNPEPPPSLPKRKVHLVNTGNTPTGVRLDNNPIAQRVNIAPSPGISRIV